VEKNTSVEFALSFINHLEQTKGYIPSPRIQKCIIRLHAFSGHMEKATSIFEEEEKKKKNNNNTSTNSIDKWSYLQVLNGFAINGDPKGAIAFLNAHLETFKQDPVLYIQANNQVLRACRLARDPFTAVDFLSKKTTTNENTTLAFDLISFNTVLSTLRDMKNTPLHKEEKEQEKEQEDMLKSKHRVELLFQVLKLMKKYEEDPKIQPDLRTYAFILNALYNYQEYQLVLKYFDEFLPKILNQSTFSSSSKYIYRFFAIYMATCEHLKETKRLMTLWSQLFVQIPSTEMTNKLFSRFLFTLKSIEKPKEALFYFRHWILFHFDPNKKSNFFSKKQQNFLLLYNQMMDICHTFDQLKYVVQLFETLKKHQIQPNVSSYIQVILAFEKMNKWPKAMEKYLEMKKIYPSLSKKQFDHSLELQKIALGRYELKQNQPN
jgi:tetratricopeptide (TPR) repeat protein